MEEVKRSKRRRIYSFDPTAIIYTAFLHKYMSYLLPALLKAANGNKTTEIEKIVRFEVDMALVLSTNEFKWSRALKHKLEEGMNTKNLHKSPKCHSKIIPNSQYGIIERLDRLQPSLAIPRPLVLVQATRPRRVSQRMGFKKNVLRGEEEVGCRVRVLRRILPGGSEMGMCELFSEVESYVVCLQLQVDILRSLVDSL